MSDPTPDTIDAYIGGFPAEVAALLERIRQTIRAAAPEAEERISYRMPAFTQGGVLIYFAAFKRHIGVYPPVRGDAALMADLAPYAGPKGNLRFPLDEPFPLPLLSRVVAARLAELAAKASARRARQEA
ncbi:MAG: hypothetical protein CVU56_20170 [Deltaproteobacteria bacterium HGW-Deltaproteobacteria-14]|jgi:uncharacterized protein YdhG (YjbR/CyaY superfamily)|nr:MAG: hypothetical protein CVU56_20170 [Deltaproteobacteria bacterium HGW-Deltaproteobacteria-14]